MSPKISTLLIFLVVGGTAFILDVALLEIFRKTLSSNPIIARIPGFFMVTLYTWLLNRRFTFKTENPLSFQEYSVYLAGSSVGIVINWAIFSGMVMSTALCQTYPALGIAAGTIGALFFNFMFYSKLFEKKAVTH